VPSPNSASDEDQVNISFSLIVSGIVQPARVGAVDSVDGVAATPDQLPWQMPSQKCVSVYGVLFTRVISTLRFATRGSYLSTRRLEL
jgi:hypothetical protein